MDRLHFTTCKMSLKDFMGFKRQRHPRKLTLKISRPGPLAWTYMAVVQEARQNTTTADTIPV